jgi:hypothetical protein
MPGMLAATNCGADHPPSVAAPPEVGATHAPAVTARAQTSARRTQRPLTISVARRGMSSRLSRYDLVGRGRAAAPARSTNAAPSMMPPWLLHPASRRSLPSTNRVDHCRRLY